MAKPVRMADIAEKLGISIVSVSKALAGKPGVSEEMRARVAALAKEMGYEPAKARGAAGATNNIGVLVSDRSFSENTFYTNLYRSLVIRSGSAGYTCMMEIVSPEAERGAALPSLLSARKADGILFMGNFDPAFLRAAAGTGIPCLLLDFHIPGRALDCVISDNLDGGFALTEHLLSRGRRKIGFVGSIWSASSVMERYLGYQRALRTAGIVPREEWLLEDRDAGGHFLPLRLPEELPEAFLCSCDEAACNLMDTLRRAGVRVPEDVAVCGYGGFRFAARCTPALTTYQVNVEQMASAAVSRLTRKIRREPMAPMIWTVPGHMVVRESTGPESAATKAAGASRRLSSNCSAGRSVGERAGRRAGSASREGSSRAGESTARERLSWGPWVSWLSGSSRSHRASSQKLSRSGAEWSSRVWKRVVR